MQWYVEWMMVPSRSMYSYCTKHIVYLLDMVRNGLFQETKEAKVWV